MKQLPLCVVRGLAHTTRKAVLRVALADAVRADCKRCGVYPYKRTAYARYFKHDSWAQTRQSQSVPHIVATLHLARDYGALFGIKVPQ